jgi:peptidoglycan-N-acetylglucosamine deacetylase
MRILGVHLALLAFIGLLVGCKNQSNNENVLYHPVVLSHSQVVKQDSPIFNKKPLQIEGKQIVVNAPSLALKIDETRAASPIKQIAVTKTNFQGTIFVNGSRSKKEIALTFDDGPDVYNTTKILDILNKYQVHATFFIVGTQAETHPEMVKKIAENGYAIGNHSWDHPDLTRLSNQQIYNELSKTNQLLYSIVGYYPDIFRPPYGSTNHRVVKEIASMGYAIIDWSVDTRDWAGISVSQIMRNVHQEMYPGGIILEHSAENSHHTIQALPEIITELKAQGYTFVTIPELLKIPDRMK